MRNIMCKLICLFLLVGATYMYGQRTAYENKVIEIKAKYLRKFGMPAQEVEILRKRGDILLNSALNQQANKYEKRYGNAVMLAAILEMGKEIKEAEKLKTAVDFNKKISAEKASEEYRRKEEAKRQAEQKKQEERAKKEEQEKALKKAKEMEVYRIREHINEHFHRWAKRGEFEKTEDYNNRMSRKKEYLDKLVVHTFALWIKGTKSGKGFRPEIDLLQYDVDKEEYQIEVKGTFLRKGSGWFFVQQDTINVDVETAKKMKSERTLYLNDEIPIEDIVIVEDSYIFIDKFKYNDKYYPIKIDAPYTKLSDYTFTTEELGLTEYFEENYHTSKIEKIHFFVTDKGFILMENRAIQPPENFKETVIRFIVNRFGTGTNFLKENSFKVFITMTANRKITSLDVKGGRNEEANEEMREAVIGALKDEFRMIEGVWKPAVKNSVYVDGSIELSFGY